jgi:hypothetical protein
VHSLLESEGENDFTERAMAYEAGGITVTGRIDNYDMKNGVIGDYKTASVVKVKGLANAKHGDFSDWYLQGMIYARFEKPLAPGQKQVPGEPAPLYRPAQRPQQNGNGPRLPVPESPGVYL